MQDKNMDKHKLIYIIAVKRYKEENQNIGLNNLFPLGWHTNGNYRLKTNIIASAIKEHVLVKDTDLYKKTLLEGIKKY